jgi:hypothetical protein
VVDTRAELEAPLEGFVDLLTAFDLEGEVLDPHVVVGVLTAVRRSKPKVLLAEAKVHDLLRAAITRDAEVLLEAERPEDPEVEGEGPADVTDAKVDVLDSARGHGTG